MSMTPQEIVKQGLEAAKDETAFRVWASRWLQECTALKAKPEKKEYIFSLASLAFGARELADNEWQWAFQTLWFQMPETTYCDDDASDWMAKSATPYHWIVAGCIALEMQKGAK
jgi:hypothetical protein